MKKLCIRFLVWLLALFGVKIQWAETPTGQQAIAAKPTTRKCTIRTYKAGEKVLVSHSICDGPLLDHAQAREKMGVSKLTSTVEETHLV